VEFPDLVAALARPAAYAHPVDRVEVHQTHISAVFLAGPYAYKVKKPLALGFLDYSTLALRRHFCALETALNRRLAPEVYLGVVPVVRDDAGVKVEGTGPAVEWAVKMVRLPADATLDARLARGALGTGAVEALARRIAAFHAEAESNAEAVAAGRFDAVAGNARDNFSQSTDHVGVTVSRTVFERARALTDRRLAELAPLIARRAGRGVPRDGHGDLRLDHVYAFPDRPPPGDLVIVDAIEFNARFRQGDPVADMAFLEMDLTARGRPDLARAFADAYFDASHDPEGRALLPFYHSYRAAVRGKVEGIKSREPEVAAGERAAARDRARAYWLLALGAIEDPGHRPCLILVGGLPGTGKSTLARGLAGSAGFEWVRTDVVRKELAGPAGARAGPAPFGQGIYSREWTDRTYAECLRRAEGHLFEGRRVLVDASFGRESVRRMFLDAAVRWGVPGVLLLCEADRAVALARIEARRGDASDADASVYVEAARRWEEPGPDTRRVSRAIPTGGDAASALRAATEALIACGCAAPD
jgi:aminoglycoside phosphotransferase family enzyme/predicted kinase